MTPCSRCGEKPEREDELALSIALTDHYSDRETLERLGSQIAAGKRPSVDPNLLAEYRGFMSSPEAQRMMAMMGGKPTQEGRSRNNSSREAAFEQATRVARRLLEIEAEVPGTVRMRANPLLVDDVVGTFKREFGLRKPFLTTAERFLYDSVLRHDFAMARILASSVLAGPSHKNSGLVLCWTGHGRFGGGQGPLALFDFENGGMRDLVMVLNIEPFFGRMHDLLEAPP